MCELLLLTEIVTETSNKPNHQIYNPQLLVTLTLDARKYDQFYNSYNCRQLASGQKHNPLHSPTGNLSL
jgi:hypothetical protein